MICAFNCKTENRKRRSKTRTSERRTIQLAEYANSAENKKGDSKHKETSREIKQCCMERRRTKTSQKQPLTVCVYARLLHSKNNVRKCVWCAHKLQTCTRGNGTQSYMHREEQKKRKTTNKEISKTKQEELLSFLRLILLLSLLFVQKTALHRLARNKMHIICSKTFGYMPERTMNTIDCLIWTCLTLFTVAVLSFMFSLCWRCCIAAAGAAIVNVIFLLWHTFQFV